MTNLFLRISSSLLFHNFLALTLTRTFCFCRLVAAVKARVARLEIVVGNISLAKLIERIMQVDRPLLKRCLLVYCACKTGFRPTERNLIPLNLSLYPIPPLCLLKNFSALKGSRRL